VNEENARKYIKALMLRNKPNLLNKALEHYKVRYGHTFWEVLKVKVDPQVLKEYPPEEVLKQSRAEDSYEKAKTVGLFS
jgi:hypothetical protein